MKWNKNNNRQLTWRPTHIHAGRLCVLKLTHISLYEVRDEAEEKVDCPNITQDFVRIKYYVAMGFKMYLNGNLIEI
jgi:hypothetical protein